MKHYTISISLGSILLILMLHNASAHLGFYHKTNSAEQHYHYVKSIPDSHNKCYSFSRVAKPGKVSLFIISTHWCAPCIALKDELEQAFKDKIINADDVDVYSYMVSESSSDNYGILNQKSGYRQLKYIDKLTNSFPTTYIVSPTTNCYTIIEGNQFDSIISIVKGLVAAKKQYFDIKSLGLALPETTDKPSYNPRHEKHLLDSILLEKHVVDSLQKSLNLKEDSVLLLQRKIDSINSEAIAFTNKLSTLIKSRHK